MPGRDFHPSDQSYYLRALAGAQCGREAAALNIPNNEGGSFAAAREFLHWHQAPEAPMEH